MKLTDSILHSGSVEWNVDGRSVWVYKAKNLLILSSFNEPLSLLLAALARKGDRNSSWLTESLVGAVPVFLADQGLDAQFTGRSVRGRPSRVGR
jgi:hypothetical protein